MENRKRKNQVKIYLSDEELEALKKKTEAYDGSMSEFIRLNILNSNPEKTNVYNENVNELIRQYKAMGNNINQLTRAVHQGKCQINKDDLESIRKELMELWLLLKWLKGGAV